MGIVDYRKTKTYKQYKAIHVHWRIEGGAKGALPPPPLKLVKV